MPELILAVDVGTTTAKAAVVDPQGAVLGAAASPLRTQIPSAGLAQQDAQDVWRRTRAVMRRALAASGRAARDLAAIGLTTQRASALAWSLASGRPVSPLVLWSDLRGAGRADELRQAGFLLAPQQPATKLESILAGGEAASGRLAWGALDSWLVWKLTGGAVHATDRSQAWPTGYLGLSDLAWNPRLIEAQALRDVAFPRLVDTWGEIGMTSAAVLGTKVPITAVVADQQAAIIAHGEASGVAKITWGTSGTFDLLTAGPVFAGRPGLPPMIVSSVAGETRFCLEGMILSAGSALDWLRGAFALGAPERVSTLVRSAPDAGGVAFLPALQGLGAPHGLPARLGRLVGLSAATTRPHIARAAYEGLAFRAREILERAQDAAPRAFDAPLGIDGGLSRDAAFGQCLADLLGRPVRPLATPEATLIGAAILAARGAGLGCETAIRAAIAPATAFEPQIGAGEAQDRFSAWSAAVHGP
jgi:glycerol kinase